MGSLKEILTLSSLLLGVCAILASLVLLWTIIKQKYSLIFNIETEVSPQDSLEAVNPNDRLSRREKKDEPLVPDFDQNVLTITRKISSRINGVYVQQFLANTISVLQSCLEFGGDIQGIPQMKSAYPRRQLRNKIKEKHLQQVIEYVIRRTNITQKDVINFLKGHLHEFLQTQRESVVYGYEKVDIRRIAQGMEEAYPEFYEFRPLHEADLIRLFEAEGIRVIPMKQSKVLAALIMYTDSKGKRQPAVIVKDDGSVPQALKEFALAHELGHWFAHIKPEQTELIDHLDFFLHSFHDLGPFENEANKIGLLTLFPTPYLSRCDVYGTLSADSILKQFAEGMDQELNEELSRNMKAFIERRIEIFYNYKRLWLELLKLPNVPLRKQALPLLIDNVFSAFSWAYLDSDYIIVDANDKFAQLVGLSKDELLRSKKNIVQLSEPEAQPATQQQLEVKRRERVPKFYITKYNNLRTKETFPVTIYAFPVVDQAGEYVGSFGLVMDIRERRQWYDS